MDINAVFYCRKLWTYNLGIRDSSGIYMAMWSEDESGHWLSEIISCIHAYIDSVKPEKKTSVARRASCGCFTGIISYIWRTQFLKWIISFLFLVTLSWIMTETLESLNRRGMYHMFTFRGWFKLVETADKKVFTHLDERQGIYFSGTRTTETCVPQNDSNSE
jgi:hypothetical protein